MPHVTELLEPDLFVEHAGVNVFHTYKDDDYEAELEYRYAVQLKKGGGMTEDDMQEFDVRSIGDDDHAQLIKSAIDDGGRESLIQMGRDNRGVASEITK